LFVITVYFGVNATVTPIPSSVFALFGCSEFEERDRRCEVVVEPAGTNRDAQCTYRRLLDQ